jgi:hypothetical protein
VTVPRLGDLLSSQPGAKLRLDDDRITTRCPSSSCFALQCLADCTVVEADERTRYECTMCGTTMVMIARDGDASPDLPNCQLIGDWRFWAGPAGVNLRLANRSRVRARPQDPK